MSREGRRSPSLDDTLAIVDVLDSDAGENKVIECSTIVEYAATVMHRIGKDSDALSFSTVTTLAQKRGITFKSMRQPNMRMAARIEGLETALADAVRRIDELERVYIEEARLVQSRSLPEVVRQGVRNSGAS